MKRTHWAVLILFLTATIALGAAPPEPGDAEPLLRDAYGRVALYIKAGQAFHADQDGIPYRPEDEIRIELRNVQSGTIAQIADSPYGMLVDRPAGYALNIGAAARRLDDGPEHFYYDAQWLLKSFEGGIVEDWLGTPVREALQLSGAPEDRYDSYVSYEVALSLGGRSRTYRALALHHRDGYDFIDTIIGGSLIAEALRETRPPIRTPWPRYAKMLARRAEGVGAAKRDGTWAGDWTMDENASRSFVRSRCDDSPDVCDPLSCNYAACAAHRLSTNLICSTCEGGDDKPGGCVNTTSIGPESLKSDMDTTDHAWGEHRASSGLRGKCIYTNCTVLCNVSTTFTNSGESGWTHIAHVTREKLETTDTSSAQIGVAPGACKAVYAFAVKGCLFGNCSITLSFQGLGATSDGFWTYSHGLENSCAAAGFGSPILVDVAGDGFDLTDLAGGVAFDLKRSGRAHRIAWTSAASDDAFLALDRNGNGTIDDGGELFGNFTDQPESADRNGFSALAELDQSQNGGNGDGLIDNQDAVFGQLRLWRDSNHNGSSEPSELSTLSAASLTELELDYKESKKKDGYGNQFRYRAKIRHAHDSVIARWAWDVFLLSE